MVDLVVEVGYVDIIGLFQIGGNGVQVMVFDYFLQGFLCSLFVGIDVEQVFGMIEFMFFDLGYLWLVGIVQV